MRWNGETEQQMRSRWMDGIKCFAWLPVQLQSGSWVWLETYWSAWVPTHSASGFWRSALTQEETQPQYKGPKPRTPNG